MTIFPKFHIREDIFQRPYNRNKAISAQKSKIISEGIISYNRMMFSSRKKREAMQHPESPPRSQGLGRRRRRRGNLPREGNHRCQEMSLTQLGNINKM